MDVFLPIKHRVFNTQKYKLFGEDPKEKKEWTKQFRNNMEYNKS